MIPNPHMLQMRKLEPREGRGFSSHGSLRAVRNPLVQESLDCPCGQIQGSSLHIGHLPQEL